MNDDDDYANLIRDTIDETIVKDVFLNDFFEEQTEEICLEVVKQNGYALQFIREQTPEICLAALNHSWSTVMFNFITIPIEGDFERALNKMKLTNGPMK